MANINGRYRYEVHRFSKANYELGGGVDNGGFPENTYYFDTEESRQ